MPYIIVEAFFKDGSYIYGEIFKDEKTKDANFTDTLLRVTQGISRFEYASHIDVKRMQDLFDILNILKKQIYKLLFLSPLSLQVCIKLCRINKKNMLILMSFL